MIIVCCQKYQAFYKNEILCFINSWCWRNRRRSTLSDWKARLDCKISYILAWLSFFTGWSNLNSAKQLQISSLWPWSSVQGGFLLRISFSFLSFMIFIFSVSTNRLETISLCCSTCFVLLISTAMYQTYYLHYVRGDEGVIVASITTAAYWFCACS